MCKIRVIPRTVRSTGAGTTLGNVAGTRFFLKGTRRMLPRFCGDSSLSTNVHRPSIVIMSPPQGKYSRRYLSAVLTVGPRQVICIDYSSTALTQSLQVLISNKCRLEGIQTFSRFTRAKRIRAIYLVSEGRGWVTGDDTFANFLQN